MNYLFGSGDTANNRFADGQGRNVASAVLVTVAGREQNPVFGLGSRGPGVAMAKRAVAGLLRAVLLPDHLRTPVRDQNGVLIG
jgi:hypothetical protein